MIFEAYQRQGEELKTTLEQLQKNESLIGSLQDQLTALAGQTNVDKELLNAQLKQMNLNLMVRNEECQAMLYNIQYVTIRNTTTKILPTFFCPVQTNYL